VREIGKSERKSAPLKWQLFLILVVILIPVSLFVYLYFMPAPKPHYNFIAVSGKVLQITNGTEQPVFNATTVAITDGKNFEKSFTNETGDYEIWVKYPENYSIPIFVMVFNEEGLLLGMRNQTLPDVVICIEATETYTVWGPVIFEPIIIESWSNTNGIEV